MKDHKVIFFNKSAWRRFQKQSQEKLSKIILKDKDKTGTEEQQSEKRRYG